jgi:hypothetical protein
MNSFGSTIPFERLVWLGLALGSVLVVLMGWLLLDPAPPRTIRIATGAPGGFYDSLGKRYRSALMQSGIDVQLVPTTGSVENIRLLLEDNDIDVAFVQGGITRRAEQEATLRSLASLAIEPLWIFAPTNKQLDSIEIDSDVRVAAGERGSGTRDLAVRVLSLLGREKAVQLVDVGGNTAADALLSGTVDFAVFVTSPSTPWIQKLLRSSAVKLVEARYTSSLARVLPFTAEVFLPTRVLDFKRRIPQDDLKVLGVATSLVVTPAAHPAIKQILLSKSQEIIDGEAVLGTLGQFPSQRLTHYPLDPEAVRYFEYGPTILRRYLPYWLANLVERFWVLLLPLITIVIPIIGLGPATFEWSMRRRIYKWYRELATIEAAAEQAGNEQEVRDLLGKLDELQHRVKRIHVTLPFRRELYALRAHIAFVAQSISQGPHLIAQEEVVRLRSLPDE